MCFMRKFTTTLYNLIFGIDLHEQERLERERLERERLERMYPYYYNPNTESILNRAEKERLDQIEREKLELLKNERLEEFKKERNERFKRKILEIERLEYIEKERVHRLEMKRIEYLERERLERERLERENERERLRNLSYAFYNENNYNIQENQNISEIKKLFLENINKYYDNTIIDGTKSIIYNKIHFHSNKGNILAGGVLFYRFCNNTIEYLTCKTGEKFSDIGGKTELEDNTIYDTICREVIEETNNLISK